MGTIILTIDTLTIYNLTGQPGALIPAKDKEGEGNEQYKIKYKGNNG
jgi:hypothetical protein